MTSWSENLRLELVKDRTMTDVWSQLRRLPASKERTALRREFQGWFSKDWDDLEVLWLPHFKEWSQ
jgi:hypothetical protein